MWFSEYAFPMKIADWRQTNGQKWYKPKLISEGPEYSVTSIGGECTCYAFSADQLAYIDKITLREWLDVLCCFLDLDKIVPTGPCEDTQIKILKDHSRNMENDVARAVTQARAKSEEE